MHLRDVLLPAILLCVNASARTIYPLSTTADLPFASPTDLQFATASAGASAATADSSMSSLVHSARTTLAALLKERRDLHPGYYQCSIGLDDWCPDGTVCVRMPFGPADCRSPGTSTAGKVRPLHLFAMLTNFARSIQAVVTDKPPSEDVTAVNSIVIKPGSSSCPSDYNPCWQNIKVCCPSNTDCLQGAGPAYHITCGSGASLVLASSATTNHSQAYRSLRYIIGMLNDFTLELRSLVTGNTR